MLSSLFRLISPRFTFALIALFCFCSLGYALYSQYYHGDDPCPLCIAQRIIYLIIGVIALLALIVNCKKLGNYIYGILTLGFAGFGIKVAAHHVWLQSLPQDQWPASCGMPLEILYKRVPLSGFLHTILSGSAECAAVTWTIFGISSPIVSLAGYSLCALGALYVLIYRKPQVRY